MATHVIIYIFAWFYWQPNFASGYTGVSTTDGAEQQQSVSSDDQEMSENDQKVIQELKDWDLWYVTYVNSQSGLLNYYRKMDSFFYCVRLISSITCFWLNACCPAQRSRALHKYHQSTTNFTERCIWLDNFPTTSRLTTKYRGPLLVCLALAVLLSFKAPTNQASLVFAAVFITVCGGSAIVTINAQLLGANISFFQSVCVLGYCIFPMTVSALVIDCLKLTWFHWAWLDMIWIAAGFLWATRASSVFIGLYVQKERRFLAVFPVLFFYTFVGWMILIFWAYQVGELPETLSTIISIKDARFGWREWRNGSFVWLTWQSLWLALRMGRSHDTGANKPLASTNLFRNAIKYYVFTFIPCMYAFYIEEILRPMIRKISFVQIYLRGL